MFTKEFLQIFAYILYICSLMGYVVLDGFDLGVGSLYLLIKGDKNRRTLLNAIGPVWDGNAVWIVISLGSLLAAFPLVYSSILSGLYIPSMLIIFGFMLRAASIEFRSKIDNTLWKKFFDGTFAFGSLITIFILGLVIANLMKGLPIDAFGEIDKSKLTFFDTYSCVCALMVLTLFSLHGALFLLIKCEGALRLKIKKLAKINVVMFVLLWVLVGILTFFSKKTILPYLDIHKALLALPLLVIVLQLFLFKMIIKDRSYFAFATSAFTLIIMMVLYALTVYPNLIFSSIDPSNNLTIFNSSSSYLSLMVIFIVGIMGLPLSFFYFKYLYSIFAGKVIINETSY